MRLITKLILASFVTELALFIGVSAVPYYNPVLVSQFNSTATPLYHTTMINRAISIFSHNLIIAILDAIPFFGLAMLGFSMIDTALTLSAYSTSQGVSGLISSIFLLTLPHSWLELPSYAIAAGSGLYIGLNYKDWKRGVLTLIIMPIELLVAAFVESSEISIELAGGNPYISWAYGAPAIAGIVLLYYFIQKLADKVSIFGKKATTTTQSSKASPVITPQQDFWKKAEDAEKSGDLTGAMNSYWDYILNVIFNYGIKKFTFKPVSVEDYYTVLIKTGDNTLVQNFDNARNIYLSKDTSRFSEFKENIKYLKDKLAV
ncbi:MAG: stage II sporulation protein M [Sulfolobaceae archaeon]|nr:stage II sporulation protein M [Sulfolobaceae archaeon]